MPDLDAELDGAGPPKMPAEFGLATATFVIVASMVGVGVLTTSGFTVYSVGSNQLMLVLWVVGGVIALCGALTLAELSAALPESGGDYVYLYEAYGPLPAFLSGWVSFLIGFAAPSAAAAFGAAKYLLVPFPLGATTALLAQRGLATLAILGFAAVHVSSRQRTAPVQGIITAVEDPGARALRGRGAGHRLVTVLAISTTALRSTGSTAVSMLFSLVYHQLRVHRLERRVVPGGRGRSTPRNSSPGRFCWAPPGSSLLYFGLNFVYGLALSVEDIRAIVHDPNNHLTNKSDAVATIAQLAANRLFGARWSDPLSVAVGLMLLSSLSAYVLTGPRVIYAMAVSRQFPSFAGRLTTRAGTPGVATVLQVGLLARPALDRVVRETDRVRQRRLVALLDPGHQRDLRSALAPSRPAPTVPDAGISLHPGRLHRAHDGPHPGGLPQRAPGFHLRPAQHPGGDPDLLCRQVVEAP